MLYDASVLFCDLNEVLKTVLCCSNSYVQRCSAALVALFGKSTQNEISLVVTLFLTREVPSL